MFELIESALSGVNVVYTTLLVLVLVYWCIVILGVIDMDGFDVDASVDAGGDLDAPDAGHGGFSWLAFFNAGEVPIMFFVSLVVLTMWVVSMQINYWLDGHSAGWIAEHRGWLAAAMAVPNFIFAIFLAKILLIPARRMRQHEPQRTNLVGKTCLVTSLEVTDSFGRCEMPKRDGSLILNVRTRGGEMLTKGDAAEIVELVHEGNQDVYIVTKKAWEE
jgi:hypothetical protein